jgi:broad specificity phosphatase PhoE
MSNLSGNTLEPAAPDTNAPPPLVSSRLLLVRHGESTWNREGRVQGQLDPPLTERGQAQVKEVAQRMAGHRVVAMYTSDLRRARQTAAPIAEQMGVEPVPLAELREINLGEWQGKTHVELRVEYPDVWRAWTRHPSWDLVPGSEGADAFERRVRGVMDQLFARHPQGDILCVTHGGLIQVALGNVVGSHSDGVFPFLIENCSLSVLERTERGLVITAVNDTCHLL